jgi:nucleoid-associated protein YgaU
MANGIRNALLFGGGALVAALAVAYGLGAFTPAPVEKVAETAQPGGNSMTAKEGRVPAAPQNPTDAVPDKQAAAPAQAEADKSATKNDATAGDGATATESGTQAAAEAGAAKGENVTAPSFDVVRVEGKGSIVVAGRSAPGAKVEILSGKSVLGTSTAGAEGDFAIALDDPLKPGDYQLVLRATTPANVVAMSKETAVVSIPEHENGQVLALVETPGQPSKLITVPKPGNAAATAPAPAIPASTGSETAQAKPQPTTAQPSGDGTATSGAASGNVGTGQEMATSTAKPAGEGLAAGTAQSPAKASTGHSGNVQVSVEAVEIEGNKIFVAGVADPGTTVRVYANDMVLGEAKTSPVGRFLVESIHELAVGDYIIRADMLAPDGVKVAARAAVPFTRAPGESVAAVASGEAGSGNAQNGAAAPAGAEGTAASGQSGNAVSGNAANSMAASSGRPSAGEGSNGAAQAVASGAQGSAVLPSLDSDISKQPPTVVSPKLQETSGAVIIRRGDTLWQISRRLYGHGVRYSTIYLANQDQIEDPNLIWPGQIFAVPGETKEGETADMKAIAGQATELPKKATE